MEVYKKIADARKQLDGKIVKNAKASMGKFSYTFISLDKLLDLVDPVFADVGLSLHFVAQGECENCTIVDLDSGEKVVASRTLKYSQDFQEMGKWCTYSRRYMLLGLLGCTAGEDDDGAKSRGGEVTRKTSKPTKAKASSRGDELSKSASMVKDKEQFKIFLHAKAEELRQLGKEDKDLFSKALKMKCKEFGLSEAQAVDLIKGK